MYTYTLHIVFSAAFDGVFAAHFSPTHLVEDPRPWNRRAYEMLLAPNAHGPRPALALGGRAHGKGRD